MVNNDNPSDLPHETPALDTEVANPRNPNSPIRVRRRTAWGSTGWLSSRWAAFVELAVGGIVLFSRILAVYVDALEFGPKVETLFFLKIASDLVVLLVAGFYILDWFTLILTGRTIVTSFLSTLLSRLFEVSFDLNVDAGSLSATPTTPTVSPGVTRPTHIDEVERQFEEFIERSEAAKGSAQRRPNALLFVGTLIAGIGLAFFLATLPGFITPDSRKGADGVVASLWINLLDLTPRLLMLAFIQLLAGFFLRQYRSSMEDLRYYEAILRLRESQLLSYLIRRKWGEPALLQKLASDVLDNRDVFKLNAGETTLVLEAQRSEMNEFKGVLETGLDFIKGSLPSGEKPKAAKVRRAKPVQDA
jgi:hypothetical protein